jgi:hypothetical protein
MTIEQIAEIKTAQVQKIIKAHISIGGKGPDGAVNLLKVGEAAGLQNVGHILSRKGVSLNTIFKVVAALNTLLPEDQKESLNNQLGKVWS